MKAWRDREQRVEERHRRYIIVAISLLRAVGSSDCPSKEKERGLDAVQNPC